MSWASLILWIGDLTHCWIWRNTMMTIVLTFPGGSVVKNPPAMQEKWIWSLGWEDPLEKEMATHSSILAWEVPWTEELCGLQSVGSQRVRRGWSDLAWMHAVSLMLSERIWRARGMDISFLKFRFSIKIFDFCYWQQTLSVNFPWHSFFVKMSAQYLSLSKHSLSVITCPSKNGDPWKTQLVQLIS